MRKKQHEEIARDAEMVRYVGFNVSSPGPSGMVIGWVSQRRQPQREAGPSIINESTSTIMNVGSRSFHFRGHPGSCRGSAAHKHFITTHPRFFPLPLPSLFEQGHLFVSAIEGDVLTSNIWALPDPLGSRLSP